MLAISHNITCSILPGRQVYLHIFPGTVDLRTVYIKQILTCYTIPTTKCLKGNFHENKKDADSGGNV